MRASKKRDRSRRVVVGAVALAMLGSLSVGSASAGDRGGGGVIKPVKPVSGCTARLRGDRSSAYWSNVAYRTGEFPASAVEMAGAGSVRTAPVGLDGRDAEGLFLTHATIGYDLDAGEPLATSPLYPANVADDASRPGFNGVLWSSKPIIGGMDAGGAYPYVTDAAAYGAYGAEDAVALVRVGPYVVPVDPWTPVVQDGPRETREVRQRLEQGRQAWLRERGFVGQVRTFVNDAAMLNDAREARHDGPVAKFVGVSTSGDAAEEGVPPGADDEATAHVTASGDQAKVHLGAGAVTRICLPHAAGLRNSGVREVQAATQRKDEAGKDEAGKDEAGKNGAAPQEREQTPVKPVAE